MSIQLLAMCTFRGPMAAFGDAKCCVVVNFSDFHLTYDKDGTTMMTVPFVHTTPSTVQANKGLCLGCREGLRELFYGVYQKDSDKCLDALEQMGVLVGGDRTSVKRTADFFLQARA